MALPWGARARLDDGRIETFTTDSFDDLKCVPLYLEHRGPVIGEVQPANSERGLEVTGEYTGSLAGRDRFSIEFFARKVTTSEGLRIISGAHLAGVASVRRPIYRDAKIELRQRGASLLLLEGPVASGKSEVLRNLLSTDAVDVVADLTPLMERRKIARTGPVRELSRTHPGDPALLTRVVLEGGTTARRALSEGLRVAVEHLDAEPGVQVARHRRRVRRQLLRSNWLTQGRTVVLERLGGEAISSRSARVL